MGRSIPSPYERVVIARPRVEAGTDASPRYIGVEIRAKIVVVALTDDRTP